MIDFLAFVIGFFLVCFLTVIVMVGLSILYRLFNIKIPKREQSYSEQEEDKQIEEDPKEDPEGDGLVLFDDPNVPPRIR